MSENKLANMPFRTQPALKKAFEEAFAKQVEYSSYTAFHEDCLRALIACTRRGERISLPLEFLTAGKPARG